MRTLKSILLIILIIIVSAFGIGYLLPRTALVTRSMLVHGSTDQVFDQINVIKNWENWSPWSHLNGQANIKYSGPEEGSKASFAWISQSDKIGGGQISIINSYPYDSVIFSLNFGDRGNALGKFLFTKSGNETLVTMTMSSDLGNNPVNRYLGLFLNRFAGNDFDKSLMNLQNFIALRPDTHPKFNIFETDLPACVTISFRDTCNSRSINAKLTSKYKELFNIIKQKNLKVTGEPFILYYEVTPELIDYEACIKVSDMTRLSDTTFKLQQIPQRHVLCIKYLGAYNGIFQAYRDVEKYAAINKLMLVKPVAEEYATDPSLEKDTSLWQTNIYISFRKMDAAN